MRWVLHFDDRSVLASAVKELLLRLSGTLCDLRCRMAVAVRISYFPDRDSSVALYSVQCGGTLLSWLRRNEGGRLSSAGRLDTQFFVSSAGAVYGGSCGMLYAVPHTSHSFEGQGWSHVVQTGLFLYHDWYHIDKLDRERCFYSDKRYLSDRIASKELVKKPLIYSIRRC